MKRIVLTIVLMAVFILSFLSSANAKNLCLKEGSFVLVHVTKKFTTDTLQEGDRVYFVAPSDVWLDETKIVPKNSVFLGYVSMLKMPVKGVNAALSIKITNITLPDGSTKEFSGRLTNGKSDVIGGELTPPASYNKMTHLYQSRLHWSGTTQWVPSGEYEYGQHRGVVPGQNLFIVADSPYCCSARD